MDSKLSKDMSEIFCLRAKGEIKDGASLVKSSACANGEIERVRVRCKVHPPEGGFHPALPDFTARRGDFTHEVDFTARKRAISDRSRAKIDRLPGNPLQDAGLAIH